MGIAVMPVVMHSLVPRNNFVLPKSSVMGFHGEFIKSKLGIDRFAFSFLGFAFSGFFPYKQDMPVYLIPSNGTGTVQTATGKRRQSQWDGIVKFGFEMPQHWNDFLFLNVGLGLGVSHGTVNYELPSYDSQYYQASYNHVMNQTDIEKGFGLMTDEFISVFYEFDKFYIFGQVEGVDNLNDYANEGISIRLNTGIYYKIIQSD